MESLTKEKVNDVIAEIRGAIMSGNCFQDIFIPVSRDDYRIWSDMMEHIGYSFHMVRLDEMHNCLPAKNVLTYYTQGVKVHIFVVDEYNKIESRFTNEEKQISNLSKTLVLNRKLDIPKGTPEFLVDFLNETYLNHVRMIMDFTGRVKILYSSDDKSWSENFIENFHVFFRISYNEGRTWFESTKLSDVIEFNQRR